MIIHLHKSNMTTMERNEHPGSDISAAVVEVLKSLHTKDNYYSREQASNDVKIQCVKGGALAFEVSMVHMPTYQPDKRNRLGLVIIATMCCHPGALGRVIANRISTMTDDNLM
jgi:hypothetical protein